MIRAWRLDAPGQTLVLASRAERLPEVVWWGAPLPESEDLAALAGAGRIDVTAGTLDETPPMGICPQASEGFAGQPGLAIAEADGTPVHPRLRLNGVQSEGDALVVSAEDPTLGLRYSARFAMDGETGMLTARAELDCARPMRLAWLAAPVLPGPQLADETIDLAGRWIGEFQPVRSRWAPGARLVESRTGRSGPECFPGLILPGRGAMNNAGEVWALHYGWSGGHRMVAEELADGRRQVQFGHATGTEHAPETHFATAPLYACYSARGLNGCAVAFQRHLRDRVVPWPQSSRPRPVHYNSWEAVYFDHNLDELKEIAGRAAALGAERFVLDDGWFKGRDDDTTSLGDWLVDGRKYPSGLAPLIDHVQALGMEFGLWVEPEMVNPASDLYRAHPDWALGPASQPLGRHQMVLDLAREDVRDYLYKRLADLLTEYRIGYLKWDHNRVLPIADAAQARGTYALLDRLTAAFPDLEIESCASGGGRIDAGILARTRRVWLSDSNDALERLRMQHEAALFLPAAVTGSHVGPRRCHTSGRVLDIRFRAWVAAHRHMGFEMDPRELTDDEAEVLKRVTGWWKANRDWTMRADILRLDSADPAVIAEEQLAADGGRFVVFAGQAAASAQRVPRPLRLAGLDPAARYRLSLANGEDVGVLSRGQVALKDGPVDLSGQVLMQQGIALPWSFPERVWVIEGERL